jgi:hypothetical protein
MQMGKSLQNSLNVRSLRLFDKKELISKALKLLAVFRSSLQENGPIRPETRNTDVLLEVHFYRKLRKFSFL